MAKNKDSMTTADVVASEVTETRISREIAQPRSDAAVVESVGIRAMADVVKAYASREKIIFEMLLDQLRMMSEQLQRAQEREMRAAHSRAELDVEKMRLKAEIDESQSSADRIERLLEMAQEVAPGVLQALAAGGKK